MDGAEMTTITTEILSLALSNINTTSPATDAASAVNWRYQAHTR